MMSGRRRGTSVGWDARRRTPSRSRSRDRRSSSASPASPTHSALARTPKQPIDSHFGYSTVRTHKDPGAVAALVQALRGIKLKDYISHQHAVKFNEETGKVNGGGWARLSDFKGLDYYKTGAYWGYDVFKMYMAVFAERFEHCKVTVKIIWEGEERLIQVAAMPSDSRVKPQLVSYGREKTGVPALAPYQASDAGSFQVGLKVEGAASLRGIVLDPEFPVNLHGSFYQCFNQGDGMVCLIFIGAMYGEPLPGHLVPPAEGTRERDEDLETSVLESPSSSSSSSEDDADQAPTSARRHKSKKTKHRRD